jgi:hypothetical protein
MVLLRATKNENSGMSIWPLAGALALQLISKANELNEIGSTYKDKNDDTPSPPSKAVTVKSNGTLSTI